MCCTCMCSSYISYIFTVHVGATVQMNADNIPRKVETRKEVKVCRVLPVNIRPTKESFSHSQEVPVMEKGPNGVKVLPVL